MAAILCPFTSYRGCGTNVVAPDATLIVAVGEREELACVGPTDPLGKFGLSPVPPTGDNGPACRPPTCIGEFAVPFPKFGHWAAL